MSKNLFNLKNDYIFKRTFGYSGDENVTKIFLRDILKTNISDISLNNNTITEKELLDDKVGILDIKAVINNRIQCDIEMQVVKQCDIEKRIVFYWSKMFSNQLKSGQTYETLNKTIAILIADFELDTLQNIKKYATKWNLREEEYHSVILTDVLEIYIIELPKFSKYLHMHKSQNLDLWVNFIKNFEVNVMSDNNDNIENISDSDTELNEDVFVIHDSDDDTIKETKKAIQKAKEKLEELSKDEHERYLADLREKYILDQNSIERYGYLRGKKEGQALGEAIRTC